jgi:ABC-type sulfate transport system substrate-binding protein
VPKIRKQKLDVTISTSVSRELFDTLVELGRDYYIKRKISGATIAELLRYIIDSHVGSPEQTNQIIQGLRAPLEIYNMNQPNDSREQLTNITKPSDNSVKPKQGPSSE